MPGLRHAPQLVPLALLISVTACRPTAAPIHDVDKVREEPVRFQSGGNDLAGTLFIPDEPGRHPAVVLFHGSGPQPRDSDTGHWFAMHGVAALAYDKRGVGESTGNFRVVPFMTLCDDGLAAMAVLERRADIDAARIGVWGLSQGGWLGPLAAARSSDVKFVIAVSGPAVSPGEQMVFYYANELRRRGLSDAEIDEASTLRRTVWRYLSTGERYDDTKAALATATSRSWFPALRDQSDELFQRSASDIMDDPSLRRRQWFTSEMNYDPTVALKKLTVPALFVYGDQDEITPVPPSVAIIRAVITEHPQSRISIQMVPGADHGMRIRAADRRGTLAAEYLDGMSRWLRQTLPGLPFE